MTARSELLHLDLEARELSQSEFRRPLLVEAGAGTGKTSTLVARVLAWCLGRGWDDRRPDPDRRDGTDDLPPDVLAGEVLAGVTAITFTEAAAAEMADRIAEGLAAVADGDEAGLHGFRPELLAGVDRRERRRRARALLGTLDRLEARTIHAFCRHLLARYPLEAGLHPDLTVDADDRFLDEAVREVVEEATKTAYAGPPDSPLVELAVRRVGPDRVAEALKLIVKEGLRPADLEIDPLGEEIIEEMVGRLRRPASELSELLAERRFGRSGVSTKIAVAVADSVGLLEALPADRLERAVTLCSGLSRIWTDSLLKRLRQWRRADFNATETKTLGPDLAAVAEASGELEPLVRAYGAVEPELLGDARRALAPMLAQVRSRLEARGVVTFNDLLREARDLLTGNPGVAARERRRIRQLLVDEFQDTDRLQCDLVRSLALAGEPGSRPGLFVVGDPKQSIYGWRSADLEAFSEFREDLLEAGGLRLVLYRNFRSAPVILAEVERAVAPVMQEVEHLQPPFAELIASERTEGETGFARGRWAPVEYWISWRRGDPEPVKTGPDTLADDAARIEAAAVAADISALHAEAGVDFGGIGLLLRATGKLEVFLAALREAGVPFTVAKDKSYFRRREIIEAAALVRTILNPTDHLALVTLLRSPMVGVPDAALVPLWSRGLPGLATRSGASGAPALDEIRRIVREAAGDLPSDIPGIDRLPRWPESLVTAMSGIAALRDSFRSEDPDVFLERLRRVFLQEATEAARFLGSYRLANLERFFHDLESELEQRGGDVEAIQRILRRSVRESEEADEAQPGDASEAAVKVMSIHGAKGLQFDHVYLVQLHAESRPPDRRSDKLDLRGRAAGRPAYRLFGTPTPDFHRSSERERRVESAERVRTLYVAMTRARERLVLVGRWPAIADATPWDRSKSHLDLLQSRLGVPAELEVLAREMDGSGGWADAGGARWKLAGSVSEASGGRGRGIAAPGGATGDGRAAAPDTEADLARVATRRSAARARMDRPWSAAASAESAERLGELLAAAGGTSSPAGPDRAAARAIGGVFHRALELWDLDADPEQELERRRAEALVELERDPTCDAAGLARARELFDRFAGGRLRRRFHELAPRILGREVPVLLPPSGEGVAAPVGFTSGLVDLIYRDLGTGEPVIVDFKTDRVETEDELAERALVYRPQEELYAESIQGFLDLSEPPQTELWFVWPDRLWKNDAHEEIENE